MTPAVRALLEDLAHEFSAGAIARAVADYADRVALDKLRARIADALAEPADVSDVEVVIGEDGFGIGAGVVR